MIFVYDLLVNFNDDIYNFYEWKNTDGIEYLKKTVLIKVSDYLYKKFVSNNIIVSEVFLNTIKDKSELLINKKIEKLNYMCILTNGKDITGFIFNLKGKIVEKTKFTLQDELELLDISESLKIKKIEYNEILNKEYKPSFITREGKKKIKEILRELNKIKNESTKVSYLYYEWFDKKSKLENPYNELVNSIKSYYSDKHNEFLKLLNIISIKNNV